MHPMLRRHLTTLLEPLDRYRAAYLRVAGRRQQAPARGLQPKISGAADAGAALGKTFEVGMWPSVSVRAARLLTWRHR